MKRLGYLAVTAFGAGALAALLLLAVCNPSCAEDYYCVSTTGTKTSGVSTTDIEGFGWANADCYATPWAAIAQMSAGDQCWVDDGQYDRTGGNAIGIGSSLSGSASDYTIIRARNHGQAIITAVNGSPVNINGAHHIRIEGFHATQPIADAGAAYYILGTSHEIYVKRCSFMGETFLVTDNSYRVLAEDCFAYGGSLRYAFQISSGAHAVIFRRCLVRRDWSDVAEPTADFATYSCDSTAYQNCVSVDGIDYIGPTGHGGGTEEGSKAFFTPNGATNTWYRGCIVMATTGMCGWWFEGDPGATGAMTDCVGWNVNAWLADTLDIYEPAMLASSSANADWSITNCTFGKNDQGSLLVDQGDPMSFNSSGTELMQDCIIYDFSLDATLYAVGSNLDTGDYNVYYANDNGNNRRGGVGSNSTTDVDPLTSGLVSPMYVNPCSALWTLASDGGPVGAQIRNRWGTDGTYMGDTGWDALTSTSLWPWPYQDEIRSKCAAYSLDADEAYTGSPAMDGARGFCGTGETLTSWLLKGGE